MIKDKEEFLQKNIDLIVKIADARYRAGDKEHGGDLRDLTMEQLIDNAIEETVDTLHYLLTMKSKL